MGLENYHVIDKIGEGTYGKVFSGMRNTTCQLVAMKFIEDVRSPKEDLIKGVEVLSKITHPNIAQILDFFDSPRGFCIVTELAQGNLSEVFKRDEGISEEEVQKITEQLVGALRYLHSKGIVHCDVKPKNILIFDGEVFKICDFGLARLISPDTVALQAKTGDLRYMAPEVIQCNFYNCTGDLWSLGLLLYESFVGHLPCTTSSEITSVLMWHMENELVKYPDTMSSNLKSFLMGLLKKNPGDRLKWGHIIKHPFVAETCKDVQDRGLYANTAGTRICDAAWKGKRYIQTTGPTSEWVEGYQLLDQLENNSTTFEEAKVIVQDNKALAAVLLPFKSHLCRDEDVLALNKSLNIISNLVDVGAIVGAIKPSRVVYKMFWPLIDFIDRLIDNRKLDYNDLAVKCFVVVRKLLVKYGSGFGASYTLHWVAIVDLFKKVVGRTEEVAYGRILCESIGCIAAIASQVAQDAHKKILDYAKEKSVVDTLLSYFVTCGTSLMSGSLDFLPAACEACNAIWSLLSISEIQNTKESASVFPLNGAPYYEIIIEAVTKAFLQSESGLYAYYSCLCSSSKGTWTSVIQIILRCCRHNNAVSGVLCGFTSSLPVTTDVGGGDDHTIVSEIFSKLSCYARDTQTVLKSEEAKPDALIISDLCLVLATVAQSLKATGRKSAELMLTSSPETQKSRLSDLAHHLSRPRSTSLAPSVMLALASLFSLESSATNSSISTIGLPLIPKSEELCKNLKAVLTKDDNEQLSSCMDGTAGLLDIRIRWGGELAIQEFIDSGLFETFVNLMEENIHSPDNQTGLSPLGVVWLLSLVSQCLKVNSSNFFQLWVRVKYLELMSFLISDAHLEFRRRWGGPGGGISGVRDTIKAATSLLLSVSAEKSACGDEKRDRKIEDIKRRYIELLLKVGIPGKVVKCLKIVELEDTARPVAFLARMTHHQSVVVQLLDEGLLDRGLMKSLLGPSSPREVKLNILKIVSDIAATDKAYYVHIKEAEIFPFLHEFLTLEDPEMRIEVCRTIRVMCTESDYFYGSLEEHKIVPLLVACYSDKDKDTRLNAAIAIAGAALYGDSLLKELGGCIPQIKKYLRSAKEGNSIKWMSCHVLTALVTNSNKLCEDIISQGAMKALVKLVENYPKEYSSELLREASVEALERLRKYPRCSDYYNKLSELAYMQ